MRTAAVSNGQVLKREEREEGRRKGRVWQELRSHRKTYTVFLIGKIWDNLTIKILIVLDSIVNWIK